MGKQNYEEWKLAEAKRIRHKRWKDERNKRLEQSITDKKKNEGKKPEDWMCPRLKELRAKKKAQAEERKAKQLAKQKEARLRLEKPKCPLKFLSFYEGRNKNRKQHVGGCKGRDKDSINRVSNHSYCRKVIKPVLNAA